MEFWRHWLKRVIGWEIWIDVILEGCTISPLALEPRRGLQEKPGRLLLSVFSYMNRR